MQKAIYNELLNSKTFSDNNFDEIYSKLKETLRDNPELRAKIDEIHHSEVKKIKKSVMR